MNAIFLDTVGLVAMWNRADQWHEAAIATFELIKSKRHSFVTTSYILLECGNTASRRTYRQQPNLLRDYLVRRNEVIFPTVSDWDEAWKTYSTGDASQAGIVDQISFIVMRRLGIIEAFTNDKHFEAAGFRVLF